MTSLAREAVTDTFSEDELVALKALKDAPPPGQVDGRTETWEEYTERKIIHFAKTVTLATQLLEFARNGAKVSETMDAATKFKTEVDKLVTSLPKEESEKASVSIESDTNDKRGSPSVSRLSTKISRPVKSERFQLKQGMHRRMKRTEVGPHKEAFKMETVRPKQREATPKFDPPKPAPLVMFQKPASPVIVRKPASPVIIQKPTVPVQPRAVDVAAMAPLTVREVDSQKNKLYSLVGKLDGYARLAKLLDMDDARVIVDRAKTLEQAILDSEDPLENTRDMELLESNLDLLRSLLNC